MLDQNEYYVLYEISNIEKKIPKINNKVFRSKIKNILFNKYKYNFNNELAVRINEKKFTVKYLGLDIPNNVDPYINQKAIDLNN